MGLGGCWLWVGGWVVGLLFCGRGFLITYFLCGYYFVVGGLVLRMILISIVHVGCGVIFEYRGFEGCWGWVCRVGRVGVF